MNGRVPPMAGDGKGRSSRRRPAGRLALVAAALVVAAEWGLIVAGQEAAGGPRGGFRQYAVIEERSPFRPLPGFEKIESTTTVAPTTTMRMDWAESLYLTGVSEVRGSPVAFIERLRGSAVEDTFMLGPGETRDGYRVVSIDPGLPSVVVEYEGQKATLTFDKEKPASARAAPGKPAQGERKRPTPPSRPSARPAAPQQPPAPPRVVVPPSSRSGGLPSLRSRRRTVTE